MWETLLVIALLYALLKWFMWRISFLAVLLYFAECGAELPDAKKIQEYQNKVIRKELTAKK